MFANLPSFAIAGIMLASFFVLGKAGDVIVRALVALGKVLRIKTFVLSFVLLGLTTSLPEMLIGIYSVADGMPRLSLGNLIGGMVVLLTFVLGLNGVISGGISIDGNFARYSLCRIIPKIPWCHRLAIHDLGVIGALLLSPAFLIIDGTFSRLDGAVLAVLYLGYILYYLRDTQNHINAPQEEQIALKRTIISFIAAAFALVAVARLIVESSEILLVRFSVPSFMFGVLVLGIGTNLPELAVRIRAQKYARDVSAGNILGSAAANVLLLGLLAMSSPLSGLARRDILFSAVMLGAVVLLLIIFFRSKNQLSRYESLILILCYVLFFVAQSILR